MATTEFIAAIEVASSHIAGMAGRLMPEGSLQLLAYAGEPSSAFVRKGVVNNIDKTARALSRIVAQLEAQTGCGIDRVYVGISGQPLHVVRNSVSRQFDGEQIISTELVDALCDENRECYPSGGEVEVLDVVPQEYRIDNQLLADPVSVPGRSITGQFLNLVSRTMLKERLELSFRQAGITLADDPLIAPLALARAVLGEGEMRSGCVLVDFGADTTTVQVYKESILRHLAVIPLGGNSLTRDIATLQMEEADAEYLKLHQVDVNYNDSREPAAEPEQQTAAEPMVQLPDGRQVPMTQLCEAASARMDEILANVNRQIEISGVDADMLFAGAILTGGGSALSGLTEAFSRMCRITRVKCVCQPRIALQAAPELLPDAATPLPCTLLGLLLSGRDNCCRQQEPEVQAMPVPDASGHTADIFQDDPDAQPQAKPAHKPADSPVKERPVKPVKTGRPVKSDEDTDDSKSSSGSRGGRSLFGDLFGRMAREMFSGDDEMKNN